MAWLTETITETKKSLEWIVVVDETGGDPAAVLESTGKVNCRENMFINNLDTVYLLYPGDFGGIRFRCKVTRQRIPAELKGEGAFMPACDTDGREYYDDYMELTLEKTYEKGALPLEDLKGHGLPNAINATYVRSKVLSELLNSK